MIHSLWDLFFVPVGLEPQVRVRGATRPPPVAEKWGPRKACFVGRGEAKIQAEFPACRKYSVVACALTMWYILFPEENPL